MTYIPQQSRFFFKQGSFSITYHSSRPKDHVVNQKPSLLAKPGHVLFVGDAIEFSKWRQNIIHGASSETRKKNNESRNQAKIILSGGILASRFIEIREVEELSRVYSSSGDKGVGKDQKREQVERQAYVIETQKVSIHSTAVDVASSPQNREGKEQCCARQKLRWL